MARNLKIRDLTLRDGQQSSFATRMNQAQIDRCLPFYKDANFYAMEVWGGAVPDSVMRYLNENPWTRLETIHRAVGDVSKLTALSRGRNLFGYSPYTDEIIDGFCRNAIRSGLGIMRIFDALNDVDNVKSTVKYVKQYGGIADCATVGVIYAALGFLSAAIVGVPVARWFVRKGLNANKTGASITKEFLTGIMDEKSTATNGRETTHASTIDTLAFHVALVGIVYLITYAELSWIEAHIKPFFDQYKWLKGFGATLSMPMFFIHGLIVAWLLRTLLLKLGAGRLMDPVVQTRITGASVDYLLTATLMSIHIVVLKQYVIPIFLVAFSVTLFALALNLWFGRRTNYGPERVLCQFGCCCGSTATGLLLLRIIDPDFSTPATLELAFFNVGILVTCAPILYFFAPAFYTFTGMEILMIYGAITVIGIAAMFALKLVGQKQW